MPSSPNELEDFKTLINLSQYAAAHGYTLDRKSSSRNSAVMANASGDKIIIAKGHDQHWVYFSVHSASDPGGSIIDFVQHQGGGSSRCSLGHVRQSLRPWLNHASLSSASSPPSSSLPPTAHPLSGHTPPLLARLPRFYVYLLLSENGEVYCGYTNCIKRRLKEHNAKNNTGWTRGRRWRLLAVKVYFDRHSALIVERRTKRSKYDKRNWIRRTGRLRTLCERHGIQSTHRR